MFLLDVIMHPILLLFYPGVLPILGIVLALIIILVILFKKRR